MSSIAFYAVICVIAALVLYTQIQKITRKIDENGTLANNSPEAVRQISVQKYDLVTENFKDGERAGDEIRERLGAEFSKLQN